MYAYGNHKIMLPTDKAIALFAAWMLKSSDNVMRVRSFGNEKDSLGSLYNVGTNRVLTTIQLISDCGQLVVSPDTKILTKHRVTGELTYTEASELSERSLWLPYVLMNSGVYESVMVRRVFTGQRDDYYCYTVSGDSNFLVLLKKCSAVIKMEPNHGLCSS